MLPLSPKGLKNEKSPFSSKNGLSRIIAATKFLRVTTFSGKVVRRHSLGYLTVHKGLVRDVPFYLKFSAKMTYPLQKRRIPVDIRS